jgi:hypothetical protein
MRKLNDLEKKRIRDKYPSVMALNIIANVETFGKEENDLSKDIAVAYNYVKESING